MARRRIAVLLATWFYSGYSPLAPGTVGSVVAGAIAWTVANRLGVPPWAFSAVAVCAVPLAIRAIEAATAEFGSKDPSSVVLDEVIGLWIAIAPVSAASWPQWITALVLFRVFDIAKPFGIRRLEGLPGGRGVLADDIAAGACAMIGALLVRWSGY